MFDSVKVIVIFLGLTDKSIIFREVEIHTLLCRLLCIVYAPMKVAPGLFFNIGFDVIIY